eukprot:scaffold214219_cov73-Cyclotella_meneghiniana.AAC.3
MVIRITCLTLLKLMKEDNSETRQNAVVTISNFAGSDQNTVRLASYRDGTILEALTNNFWLDPMIRCVYMTRPGPMPPKPYST